MPHHSAALSADLIVVGAGVVGLAHAIEARARGIYAESPMTDFLIAQPHPGARVVSVTTGIGMTTALGVAPAVLDQLL